MKIVILVHNLTGGGAERVAALWASGFANCGHRVHVVTESDSHEYDYDISEDVKITNVLFPIRYRYLRLIFGKLGYVRRYYIKVLNKILHQEKPDVCIGVMGSYAIEAYNLTRDIGTKVIQTYHYAFDLPSIASKKRIFEINKRLMEDRKLLAHTVLTQADKIYIGDKLQGVYVMPNPVSFEPISTIVEKKKIILACGRLDVWDIKGLDVLIKAWGIVGKSYPDWILKIAGTGRINSLQYLKSLAIQCDIDQQIDFVGFKKNIKDLYLNSQIFVLSSRFEGFGMVLIEAMSQGCACIACDYKGRQKEIIQNDAQGIICKTDDVDDLARSLEKMISDKTYREICQHNAINRSHDFSLEKTMERWFGLFKEIRIQNT